MWKEDVAFADGPSPVSSCGPFRNGGNTCSAALAAGLPSPGSLSQSRPPNPACQIAKRAPSCGSAVAGSRLPPAPEEQDRGEPSADNNQRRAAAACFLPADGAAGASAITAQAVAAEEIH